ncbi:hypothetical protein BURKHO8Y_10069 [Burkholderia sp. 8Y]|nr:hypothetical protein BURKHO8Y_10069 [Burkholderia sp. 8Y]
MTMREGEFHVGPHYSFACGIGGADTVSGRDQMTHCVSSAFPLDRSMESI